MFKKLFAKKTPALVETPIENPPEDSLPPDAFQQAVAYHQQGDFAQADAMYRQILQHEPNHANALQLLGVLAFQLGQHDAAIELINQSIALQPDNVEAHNNLGNVFAAQNKIDAAIASFQRVLVLKPDYANVHNNLGYLLKTQGKLTEAIESFQRFLALEPNNPGGHYNLAVVFYENHEVDAAIYHCQQAIALKSDYAEAYYNLAIMLNGQGKAQQAVENFQKAISFKADYVDAYFGLGSSLTAQGRFDEAIDCYQQLLEFQPENVQAYKSLATVFQAQNDLNNAIECYRHALTITTADPNLYNYLGVVFWMDGRLEMAISAYQHALELNPNASDVYFNLAVALKDQGKAEESIANYKKALAIKADYLDAWNNLAEILQSQGDLQQAIECHQQILSFKPDSLSAYTSIGWLLKEQGKLEAAIENYQQAIVAIPNSAPAHFNLGVLLQHQNNFNVALVSYQQTLAIDPNYAEAHYGIGNVLQLQGKLDQAVQSYQTAAKMKPDYFDAIYNLGLVYLAQNQLDKAVEKLQHLLAIHPTYLPAYYSLGTTFQFQRKLGLTIETCQKALAINPDDIDINALLFDAQQHCCDWSEYDVRREKTLSLINAGKQGCKPFELLAISDSASLQQQAAVRYVNHKYPAAKTPVWTGQRYTHDKIRIAYISGDFRDHPLAYLMAGVFEQHDKQRFEIIAISLTPELKTPMAQRIKNAFSQFIDASNLGHYEIALLLKELEVDIAVDLMGLTGHCRPAIFAHRAVPIQVNYLGYPATMGADYIDYIFADSYLIPEQSQSHYTENVVYLPDCFQANDDKRIISSNKPSRTQAGLPESGLVFCAFNTSNKINPSFFAIWMRLLTATPDSVLWLVEDNPFVANNLCTEASKHGVNPERLKFASRLPYAEHLARFQLADLFLDTLSFNAGTTASDALWAGVPVISCSGEAFAARMAGSLLTAVGLPELITTNLAEYEALALKLATNPSLLADIRAKLDSNKTTSALFNTPRFCRHLESAYLTMWEKHQRCELPSSFKVPPIA